MMELPSHSDSPTSLPLPVQAAIAPLRSTYECIAPAAALAQPDVLAVIGFGAEAHAPFDDSRYVHVGLEPLAAPAPVEVWRGRAPVVRGSEGAVRWASDGDHSFAAIEVDEAEHGGIAAAAEYAYARLSAWCNAGRARHMLRIWNYLDAINEGEGDEERYRLFCSGRAAGMRDVAAASYPAATAIGRRDGRRVLQIYLLAARRPGAAIENPRQLSAWRYPRRYGPVAPSFARAMRSPAAPMQIFVSGTAAIVGHDSQHRDDASAQLAETLANLHSLLTTAGIDPTAHFGAASLFKAYVRRASDRPHVVAALRERLGAATPLLVLTGDICRSELLVEIDGVQGVSAA
ncbi:MAG TPA: pteridine-dependent deoxygenase [Rudaea sp.]|nr:pteridine-dependent deoxygenase [Rudaea sp.]